MKNILIALVALVVIGGIAYYFLSNESKINVNNTSTTTDVAIEPVTDEVVAPESDELPPAEEDGGREPIEIIGTSVGGEDIMAYHFGDGDTEVLFVGGIHSSFAPNTVGVAEELIDALDSKAIKVPKNVTVTVIPNLNPDATGEANTLAARLNENGVDLNRNFDCEWNESGTWRNQTVSGGSAPFSEPESAAARDYIEDANTDAVVVWYSAAGGVYSSNCGGDVLSETNELTNLFADASGYSANEEFDFYEITGDMVNWLASRSIPGISVLLSDYKNIEWSKNKAGIEAILEFYAK